MRIEVIKHWGAEEVQAEVARFAREYGTIENLAHKVSIGKCSAPQGIDNLVVWQALSTGQCDVNSKVVFDGSEAVSRVTPRRMELLETIKRSKAGSLKELASLAKRDYKNIYDDAKALEECGLISLEARGRKLCPVHPADEMRFTFEK